MPAYRMTLTMLSPVHIGSGEEIDPIEYVVRQEGQGEAARCVLYALDLPALLGRLTDAQRRDFNAAADQAATTYLRKFIAKTVDLHQDVRWQSTCSPETYELYQQGLDSEQSQLRITLMTRDALTGQPYIPGSSIKGALRTAWVSQAAAQYRGRVDLEVIHERDFEPEVLGYRSEDQRGRIRADIRADPFRAVSVGDAPLCADSNAIDPVEIYKPGRTASQPDPAGILMFYDMTFSAIDDQPITAAGRLTIDERLARTPARGARNWSFDRCVAGAVAAPDLLTACNTFYRPRLQDEIKRFPRLQTCGRKLQGCVEAMGPTEALIRLGRFSHVECVTVARRGGPPSQTGTTRSLAAGELPMGWAKLTLAP